MARFKFTAPLTVPLMLLKPTYSNAYGVDKKSFPAMKDGELIYGNLKTYGGTEREVNGLYSVENTAYVETWFRPDIKSDCRIGLPETGEVFEIIGEPENIERRNQYIKMKVTQVKGGA